MRDAQTGEGGGGEEERGAYYQLSGRRREGWINYVYHGDNLFLSYSFNNIHFIKNTQLCLALCQRE